MGIARSVASARSLVMLLTLSLGTTSSLLRSATAGPIVPRVTHLVEISDSSDRFLHVVSRFERFPGQTLELSLPEWTPGYYALKYYVRNVLRLEFRDGSGRRLRVEMTANQTWRVTHPNGGTVIVSFDYLADELGVSSAKITPHYAVLTGTQIFLQPIGYRSAPSSLSFRLPAGWAVATALTRSARSDSYHASTYDELVDSPLVLGHFDRATFTIGSKPHALIIVPNGTLSTIQIDSVIAGAASVSAIQQRIFGGGLPYDAYTYFLVFARADSGAGAGMEHATSQLGILGPWGPERSAAAVAGLFYHEYFHLWNVKRLRPAGMWPYDYGRENISPLLWVSEGFTNYYANMTALRATGDSMRVLAPTERIIRYIESSDAARYISPNDASRGTWTTFNVDGAPFIVSFYATGQIIATMLDICILHDTEGRARLDDAMRILWNETYMRQRGFTEADLARALQTVSGRNYSAFLHSYADQPGIMPYDSVFALIGYHVDINRRTVGTIGATIKSESSSVLQIEPASGATHLELETGDVIMSINGRPFAKDSISANPGRVVSLHVRRANGERDVSIRIDPMTEVSVRLVDLPNITRDERQLRSLWLDRDWGKKSALPRIVAFVGRSPERAAWLRLDR
jgi:predicted metalloprotease with PDZ domain